MTGDSPPAAPASLGELLNGLAAGLPEARSTVTGGRTEWARGGVTFAVLAGDGVDLRLDPAVAAAALRTPDTSESSRGRPWVRFAPRALDGHAIDRATAWFGLACRRAAAS
jgi:hypothetical protein